MTPLVKQPGENALYTLPIGDLGGGAITAVADVMVRPRGLVAEVEALLVEGATFAGPNVQFRAKSGTDGELYLITITVQTDLGDMLEADCRLFVLDLAWVVPDGSGGTYIDPRAYIARYGVEELVQLTDDLGTGQVGRPLFFAALADATAEIDGYLAKRYLTPLSPIPALISNVCADITRYRLHRHAVTEDVETRYRDAIKTLERLAQGVMVLPDVATASPASGGAPIYAAPSPVFTRQSLKGY